MLLPTARRADHCGRLAAVIVVDAGTAARGNDLDVLRSPSI